MKIPAFILFLTAIFVSSTVAQNGRSKPQPILVDEIGSSRSSKPAVSRSRVPGGRNYDSPVSANQTERRTFDLMNAQRLVKGLRPLAWDGQLAQLARLHSQNMANEKFFSHRGNDGTMVDDRAATLGIYNWLAIGENIAFLRGYDDPATMAVEKWMKSPSHKKNILNGQWLESAIGVATTSDGTIYLTQVFITR